MRFLFMDNFRGFSETFIRLAPSTFLVGENSTGKSSFLALTQLFSSPEFAFNLEFPAGSDSDLGGFSDIVSVGAEDRSFFTVGTLIFNQKPKRKKGHVPTVSLVLMTFSDNEGLPRADSYITLIGNHLWAVRRNDKGVEYSFLDDEIEQVDTEEDAKQLLLKIYRERNNGSGFKALPKGYPVDAPLTFLMSLAIASAIKGKVKELKMPTSIPETIMGTMMMRTNWIAPIRTRTSRIYGGVRARHTPEGDHIPYVMKRKLPSEGHANAFAELLKNFGKASGLFEDVTVHSFGENTSAPFEVLVTLRGKELNVGNVGYGVSQVLPVVVEMISAGKGAIIAIQQPEVHLHPKAQAALGDLMHFLVVTEGHCYIVETHSDYLIDRFRLRVKKEGKPADAQVVFFSRTKNGNYAESLEIGTDGQYPENQPQAFREFFINEAISVMGI